MRLRNIWIVYLKELTEALRDRRTLITTFLVPLLMIPLLSAGFTAVMSAVIGQAKKEKPRGMIVGGADSPAVVDGLKQYPKIKIIPATVDWKNQIIEKEIRAAVEIPSGFQQNLAPPEKVAGAILGGIIAYLVIFMCLNGGMHPAIDLTAGEKERGTMETILSSPVSRTHLVLGKFLLVLTTSLITAALLVVSMGVSFTVLQKSQVMEAMTEEGEPTPQLTLGPAAVASVFVMAIPLAILFSAGLITISLFAKSYKEAQSYIAPLMFLVVVPAVAAMLPGVELTPQLAIVPLLNVSLLCKELVTGEYHWNYIVLIFASTCVYAAGALYLAVKMFQRESVLFRS